MTDLCQERIAQNLHNFRACGKDASTDTALALAALVSSLLDAADLAPTEHWHEIVGARMARLREAVRHVGQANDGRTHPAIPR